MNEIPNIITERVDDIPLLIEQMQRMGLPTLLDNHFPTHGNWTGLSLGWVSTIWLSSMLSGVTTAWCMLNHGSRSGCGPLGSRPAKRSCASISPMTVSKSCCDA